MAWFLIWGVRVPAFIAGAILIAAGATSVLDWAAALTAAALCGFIIESAGHYANQGPAPANRSVEVRETINEEAVLKFRIADLEDDEEYWAA